MPTRDLNKWRTPSVLVLIFILLIAGIVTAGYRYCRNYERQFRAEAGRQLSAIAELKVDELVQYRKERLGDAVTLFENPAFSGLVRRFLEHPEDADAQQQVEDWTAKYLATDQYDLICLFDAQGVIRMAVPAEPPISSFVSQNISEILQSGQVTVQDFTRNEHDQRVYLALLVPILDGSDANRPLGVLALRIDPETYLYPFIKRWPTPSLTAETLLVRREGNDALFLNELKFGTNTALNLRIPLANTNVPAVKAVLGQEGIVEGMDYRGVPTLAALHAIPDSPWFLVAKMDTAEVYASLRERLRLTILLVGLLLISAGAGMGAIWRHQRVQFYKERYQMAEALRASEVRYRRLFETAKDGILILDAGTGMVVDVNPFLIEKLGFSHEAFLGKKIWELGFFKDIVANQTHFAELREKGYVRYENLPLETADGRRLEVEFVSNVYRVNHEEVVQCNIRDITERKRAEESLRYEQTLMATLMDNLPDAVYFKDTASRFLRVNRAHSRKFGLSDPAQLTGKSDGDFFSGEHAQQALADEQEIIRTGRPLLNVEEKETWLDGTVSWVLTTKLPLRDAAGRVIGTCGISHDITERKQAHDELEKRVAERTTELSQERRLLRTLIDNLPDCIYAKDAAGRKILANPADLINLRRKTEAEAIGMSDFDVFPPDIAEKFWADDQRVIHGEPVINREELTVNDKGEKHWQLTSKLPLRDQDGKIVGLVGIGRDITARKQVEEALRQSRDEFEKRVTERTAELARERQLLRTLIDRLPETFYIKDLDGRFLVVNEALAKQSGKDTPAQMLGLSDADLFPAGQAAGFRAEEMKVFAGEPLINLENSMVFPDGREHTLLTTKLPFRDSEGRICGLVGIGHDITERKRAEEALRHEQSLMATLMDNVPAAIYFKDAASRFLRVNRAHSRKFGLSDPAQLTGKSDADFFFGEHARQALADEQEIIRTGQPLLNVEEKETWMDGTVSWVLTTKLPLRDVTGRIIGTCGISLDITERKRVEQALADRTEEVSQRNQELAGANTTLQQQITVRERIEQVLDRERLLLRTLIDNLPDYVYAQDAEGRFVAANLGMARQLGFSSPNEVIGKSNFDLFPHELAARYHADEQEIVRSGQGLYHHEGPTVDASKQEKNRWVSTTKVPLRNDLGEVTGFVGLGQDITERKRAEEALRESQALYYSLAEQLPVGVFRKDREGRFILVNPEFCRLKGMKAEEFLGKTPREVAAAEAAKPGAPELATKYAAAGMGHHEQIMQTGKSIELDEEYVNADGGKQFLHVIKLPVVDPDGKIIGTQGIQFDITERKRAEEALQKNSQELQERNDELARFTYTASHDLKSPLVTVKAFLGYLEQDTLNQDAEAIKKDRHYIYTAVDKMTRLLDELLDLARVGHKMNPPEEVPLQVVVKDALDMVAGWIIQKGVEVVATKEPVMLCGDRTRLVEVFQNLVDNAVKFMGDQPNPRVEIGVEKAGEENVFFVRDNGVGIDPRYQPKVFGLFEKFDPGTRGTGIGLALVKRIVEVHGGKIWVESAGIGKGATFRFTLAKTQRPPAQP
jgi:PAS domain S-box-containing protein